MRPNRTVSQTWCFISILHMLSQVLQFLKHWLHWTFFTTSHLWLSRVTMTLLHQRQQRQISTIKRSQEWEVNSVAMTKKGIETLQVSWSCWNLCWSYASVIHYKYITQKMEFQNWSIWYRDRFQCITNVLQTHYIYITISKTPNLNLIN